VRPATEGRFRRMRCAIPHATEPVTLRRVKKTSVYLEPELDEALARRAADEGLTKAEFIRRTLAGAVQRPRRARPTAVGLHDGGPSTLAANDERWLAGG
jgi:Ribbon-helix-helix protein, copG family